MFDELIARQHGVLTRQQAYACGLSKAQVEARLRGARWRFLFGRVLATFTGPPSRTALLWAAVLRAGDGAMLSHETAAEVQGLADRCIAPIQVTVPADRRVSPVAGIRVHLRGRAGVARHPSRLPPQTRVEETVLDLAERAHTPDDALGWLARSLGRRLTTTERLRRAIGRRVRMRWRTELLAALADDAGGCHSLLELRYLRDVERAHGLPPGVRQAVRPRRGGRWYDDVSYRDYRTRVELDGRAAHPAERRWQDARRDNAAAAEGETTLRYGWTDVTRSPCTTADQVAQVLRRHGWLTPPRRCGPSCMIVKSPTAS
ncbi:hypothetical protein ACI2K4_16630 [Micromonospora sp. NPDC050397]|uniref:hypothetical protein n=1 Tax=Micromonospora sp. NPDC050397 TaxID=3364279 RepID=UPI00384C15D1